MSGGPPPGVPKLLHRGAAISWRFLAVAAALAVVALIVAKLWVLVVALSLAVLATTVLAPMAELLRSKGWHPALAGSAAFLSGLVAVALIGVVVVPPLIGQADEFADAVREGVREVQAWLEGGVLWFSGEEVREQVDNVTEGVRDDASGVARGVLTGTMFLTELLLALVLAFVITFFFLKDSGRMTAAMLDFVRPDDREDTAAMGRRAWGAVAAYVRGSAVVGLVNAVLLGAGLVVLGVPLIVPIVLLTFFGAFFPILGAWTAGIIAAGIAAITLGWTQALIVAVLAFVIQQVEGNLLEPLVLGRAVNVHPVVILLVLSAGAIAGGILGAFLAVPITAVISAVIDHKRGEPVPTRKRKRG